jgi:hypothetical protein
MNDKTPMYILIIVGIVALVAIVHMLTVPRVGMNSNNNNAAAGSAITGNVVADDIAPVDLSGVGRFILGAVLIGVSVYMYTKVE